MILVATLYIILVFFLDSPYNIYAFRSCVSSFSLNANLIKKKTHQQTKLIIGLHQHLKVTY